MDGAIIGTWENPCCRDWDPFTGCITHSPEERPKLGIFGTLGDTTHFKVRAYLNFKNGAKRPLGEMTFAVDAGTLIHEELVVDEPVVVEVIAVDTYAMGSNGGKQRKPK